MNYYFGCQKDDYWVDNPHLMSNEEIAKGLLRVLFDQSIMTEGEAEGFGFWISDGATSWHTLPIPMNIGAAIKTLCNRIIENKDK